jgi:Zn-dependent M16 (insulinase) family peptidase
VPSETYAEKQAKKERELLQLKVSELTDAEKKRIYEEGIILSKLQDQKEGYPFFLFLTPSCVLKK